MPDEITLKDINNTLWAGFVALLAHQIADKNPNQKYEDSYKTAYVEMQHSMKLLPFGPEPH